MLFFFFWPRLGIHTSSLLLYFVGHTGPGLIHCGKGLDQGMATKKCASWEGHLGAWLPPHPCGWGKTFWGLKIELIVTGPEDATSLSYWFLCRNSLCSFWTGLLSRLSSYVFASTLSVSFMHSFLQSALSMCLLGGLSLFFLCSHCALPGWPRGCLLPRTQPRIFNLNVVITDTYL